VKRFPDLCFLAGMPVVVLYVTFTLLAFASYPNSYSPMTNWLSDLGSRVLNPHGALFYNTGIVFSGLCSFLFFLSLSSKKIPGNKIQGLMVLVTQRFGLIGSFALIMSALYPIDLGRAHGFWSVALYIMLGTAFAFSVAALRYHSFWPKWLLVLGITTAAADILSGVLGTWPVMEWVTVAFFLSYVAAVALVSLVTSSSRKRTSSSG